MHLCVQIKRQSQANPCHTYTRLITQQTLCDNHSPHRCTQFSLSLTSSQPHHNWAFLCSHLLTKTLPLSCFDHLTQFSTYAYHGKKFIKCSIVAKIQNVPRHVCGGYYLGVHITMQNSIVTVLLYITYQLRRRGKSNSFSKVPLHIIV